MQAAHRVAKNTGILYARMAITVFISLYATRLVLAALGVADFGLFNVVGGVVAMLGFLNSSMAAATQRFMSFAQGEGDLEKVKRIFNMSTVLHAGIAVLMVLIFEVAGYFFLNGILNIAPDRLEVAKIIYHFMVVSTFFTILSVPYEAVITSNENMLFYAIEGIIESVIKLGIAIYIAHSAFDHLMAYGFLMAALSIFLLLLRRFFCHRYYTECQLNFRKYYEENLLKEMTSFAGWSFLTTAATMITNYGMGIVLNIFFGTLLNAAQGIANQMTGQLTVFSRTMMQALAPVISKSEGAGNRNKMMKASSFGAKTSFILSILFIAPFIVDAPFVLVVWLKNVPDYTIIFCRILLLQVLIESFLSSLSQSLSAEGNIGKSTIVRTLHNIIYLPIIFLIFYIGLEPQYMYYVMIVKTVLAVFIVLYYNKVNCGLNISLYTKDVLIPSFFISIILFSALFGINYFMQETIFNLLLLCLMSLLISVPLFYYILLNYEEKMITKHIAVTVINRIKNDKRFKNE